MTREEAKERLKSVLETGVADADVLLYTEDYEAIDYAIEALEKEPCEDCISRKAVIDEMGDTNMDIYTEEVKDFVRSLPPVTPQPKAGEWLKNGELCKCSNCHSNVLFSAVKLYNFCYRCGARMEVSDAK